MSTILPQATRARVEARLHQIYTESFGGVGTGPDHIRRMAADSVDEARSRQQLELLCEATGEQLEGKRLLEIGAGIGLTVAVACRRYGAEAVGIEPGADEYHGSLETSREVLNACGLSPELVSPGRGEELPFSDREFDFVISSNVLEHVQDPARVLTEAIRVLRPGGYLQFIVPNYGSWWEGHYGLVWLPHMPPFVARLYVRLWGRQPDYLNTLQFVSRGRVERWLYPHRDRIDILGWGCRLWEHRVRTLEFSEYSALGRLKSLLRLLHCLKVVGLLVKVGKALHWQTPIVLTARKRAKSLQ